MLRCQRCSGHAQAGLAHIHGLTEHLCVYCTEKELRIRYERTKATFQRQGWRHFAVPAGRFPKAA